MSSANMRMKLGMLGVVKRVYERILAMDTLTGAERLMAQRKLDAINEQRASASLTSMASAPSSRAESSGTESSLAAAEAEISAFFSASALAQTSLSPTERAQMLGLMRSCGAAASQAGDDEAASPTPTPDSDPHANPTPPPRRATTRRPRGGST